MITPPEPHQFAARCHACAARLRGQRDVGAFALLVSGLALAALGVGLAGLWRLGAPASAALAAALTAGLFERYLAVRLALDAHLFEALARGRIADLTVLDDALAALSLAPPSKAGRALALRTTGALRLARWHTGTVVLQCAALLLALLGARP